MWKLLAEVALLEAHIGLKELSRGAEYIQLWQPIIDSRSAFELSKKLEVHFTS